MTAVAEIGEHCHLSLNEEQGVNPNPATYEWCVCGYSDPVSCTYFNVYCADYYLATFEPCKCACHKKSGVVVGGPALAESEG